MSQPLEWDEATEELRLFLAQLRDRGFDPAVVLDVGAFTGCWSRAAKTVFPGADFFLIEPQTEMGEHLDAFCAEYPGSRWFQAAAGAAADERALTIWNEDFSGSTLLFPETADAAAQGMQTRTVPVVAIDDLVSTGELPVPQLAKLDVQGFELEALRGAESLFGTTEVFLLELTLLEAINPGWPIAHEVIGFMAERGYYLYDVPGMLRRPSDGALAQMDGCFVKSDSFLRTDGSW